MIKFDSSNYKAMAKTTTTFRQGGNRWLGVSKGRGGHGLLPLVEKLENKKALPFPAIKLASIEKTIPVARVTCRQQHSHVELHTQPASVAASIALDSSVRLNVEEDWTLGGGGWACHHEQCC